MTLVPSIREAAQERAGRREWIALAVLALPLLLVSMDVSILYFAVPEIARDLHATPTQQLWIFDVYGFVLAGLLVTMGAVADRVGARRLLLVGAVAFSATSLMAAYAQSAGELIAARALLGIAGATLMPSTMSMIRTLFHDEKQRGQAVGIWTGVMTAGVGLGPVLSGVLLAHFWWGSVFLVNIPAMALLLVLGPVLLPRGEVRKGVPFDVPSSALSLAAVLPTIYGIKEWAAHGVEPEYVGCILVGLSLGMVFLRRQLRHPHAMIDADLLRNRVFATAVGTNAISTFALVGNAVFMTAYLQLVLGYSPLRAALWSLVPTLGVGLSAPFASGLADRFGPSRVAAGGLLAAAGGFGVLTRAGTDSLLLVLVGAGILACGLVAAMTIGSELVLAAVKTDQAASGAAVSEAGTELGGALGIALLGSIGTAAYRAFAGAHLPAEAVHTPAAGSLPGALSTAAGMPAGLAEQVAAVGREAFVHGLHVAAVAGAAALVVAAVGLLTRGRPSPTEPR
ncbi:MAG TPA: MFS transporter [Nocardioides sp.]|uniref:MFS transporter n=1 Tax=Nocardioides sp. TaxID=35761 RepID=UPI002E3755F6|nr:MFS transporter [Nocardioides sp.]HEX5091014.1 MFS transporter [Nocardioides sp.]